MYLLYRKNFCMLNTVMGIAFEISSGKYIIHIICTTVLDITWYTFWGGFSILAKKKSICFVMSVCLSVSLSP